MTAESSNLARRLFAPNTLEHFNANYIRRGTGHRVIDKIRENPHGKTGESPGNGSNT